MLGLRRLALRVYRLALWLLPPAFRRTYGSALADEADVRLGEATPGWARVWAGVGLAVDLLGSVVREWWDMITEATRTGMGGGMRADVRWALRALRRSPGFTFTVVATLGLGIGASTVALGLVDAYLLRSLPYPDGDRLVSVWPQENWSQQMMDLAGDAFPSLDAVAGANGAMLVLEEGDEPRELFATLATPNLLDVVGVKPALGRGFVAEDGEPGATPVAILSHRLWSAQLGADPSVVGRTLALGGEGDLRRTVIGVMPDGYLPLQGNGVDAWIPAVKDPTSSDYSDSYNMQAVGRLSAGATPEDVRRDIRAFAARMHQVEPTWFTEERVSRATAPLLARERTSDRHLPVLVALGAALLVLLVACANTANLVVARTTGRERELSVRAALGAGRGRTARTVLVEVGVLAGTGALAGFAMAAGLVRLLERRFPSALPDWGLSMDVRWVVGAAVLAAGAALVAGLVPGLQAARRDPAGAMAGARGSTGSRRMIRLQELLSAGQLALATAGVAAMALLGRSLIQLGAVDPGFHVEHAVTFRVTAPPGSYPDDADIVRFFREARDALAGVPGVVSAGFGSRLPLAGGDSRVSVQPEGWEFEDDDPRPPAWHRLVTPGYLEAMGARLVEGRIPGPQDDRDGEPELVVINRSAARQFWPGQSAIGKTFGGPGGTVWLTVAGVVEDIRENGQAAPVLPGLYVPHRDWPWRTLYAVVRTRGDPLGLMPQLRQAVHSVASGAPVSRVATLERVAARGLESTRTLTLLAGIAGLVTLLLGALGIYGVVSHAVARRTRELGVRAALGADRGRLLRGEMLGVSRVVSVGVAVGLVLAWAAGRGLRGVLFGVPALDGVSFGVAVGVLVFVAYLAAWMPARRASGVDPGEVMREG